ncbi:MAG TPA: NAD/NADP octopine/nopaline dehydrogenase family protein [Allosphingosinicella sp.]|nr:NAD/NADP octopine/nopaline dehydrogenase family protein [Allosphingosinicella sp.]
MDIAVIGGGHGSYAAAADLSDHGHSVRLWRRDAEALWPVLETGTILLKDRSGERPVKIALVTADLGAALQDAQLVLVPLPATVQPDLARNMAPHLRDGQVVFLTPGTFGSMIFANALRAAGNDAKIIFAETPTLPWLARKHGPRTVAVTTRTTTLPTGVFPAASTDEALATIRSAFPEAVATRDVLDVVLLNGGPLIHPPLILMNAAPIEHFDRWDIHKEGTQASVRAVHDALDGERIAVREALGYGEPHWRLADHYGVGGKKSMYGDMAHDRLTASGDWNEKLDLQTHRYMREDVQLGLTLMASFGALAGVPMPVANGLLAIASAVTREDLVANGRTLASLGLDGCSPASLKALVQTGFAQ